MIRCISNPRQGGDGRYFVTVLRANDLDGSGLNPFYRPLSEYTNIGASIHATSEGNIKLVNEWIAANCAKPAKIFGSGSVVFEDEGDALLFWMSFKS